MGSYFDLPDGTGRPDVILTNPPYSMAQSFLTRALTDAPYIAMLLRLNYLGSEKRAAFFHGLPPDVYVLPNRPSFARGSTDSCEYGWFIWGPERQRKHGSIAVLDVTPRCERMASSRSMLTNERSSSRAAPARGQSLEALLP